MPPFKHFPPKPTLERPHVLLTTATCGCDRTVDDPRCPVCDWGLSVCGLCGGGEADLVGTSCPGKPEPKTPLWPCPTCEGIGRTRNNAKCPRCKGTGERKLEGRA